MNKFFAHFPASSDVPTNDNARAPRKISRRALISGVASLCALRSVPSMSQTTDQGVLRILVATPPGGVLDIVARILAQQITKDTGRNVIVENRAGAGAAVAMGALTSSPNDGSTVIVVDSGSYAIAPHFLKTNVLSENLTPVALVASGPIFLTVNSTLGVNTVKDFVALAKAKPGMAYASSGNGSSHHLAMELIKARLGIDLVHVPYKGSAQTATAVMSGEVACALLPPNVFNSEKMKVLAVAASQRSPLLPEIPSIAEAAQIDLEMRNIGVAVFTNAKAPVDVVTRLNRDLLRAARENKTRLATQWIEAGEDMSPADYSVQVKAENEKFGKLIRQLNIKLE